MRQSEFPIRVSLENSVESRNNVNVCRVYVFVHAELMDNHMEV